jgi:hypothetical protein
MITILPSIMMGAATVSFSKAAAISKADEAT